MSSYITKKPFRPEEHPIRPIQKVHVEIHQYCEERCSMTIGGEELLIRDGGLVSEECLEHEQERLNMQAALGVPIEVIVTLMISYYYLLGVYEGIRIESERNETAAKEVLYGSLDSTTRTQ